MSYYSPAMVVGTAFLDEAFAAMLLHDPQRALAIAQIQLAPGDLAPFLRGASSVADLARCVLSWERETGRAEDPLIVPALEPRRPSPARTPREAQTSHAAAIAA